MRASVLHATGDLGLTQPMAIAVHAVRRSGLRAGQDAVIVGVGGIGAFITLAAAATGARVLVVDRNEERLELASVLEAAEPGATIVPVGIQRGEPALPLGRWTLREYTIVGTVAHVFADDFPEAVRLLGTRPDWSEIASEVIPLDLIAEQALQPLLGGASHQIKTLVDPWISEARPAVRAR